MNDMPQPTAKLFMPGRRRVVRLPKEFRFGRTEVYVRRHGEDGVLSSRPRASNNNLREFKRVPKLRLGNWG